MLKFIRPSALVKRDNLNSTVRRILLNPLESVCVFYSWLQFSFLIIKPKEESQSVVGCSIKSNIGIVIISEQHMQDLDLF